MATGLKGKVVTFLGDCQAAALADIYRQFVAPLTGDSVRFVGVDGDVAESDRQSIRSADAVVSQVFNVVKRITTEGMRADALKVEFPAVFVGFLWPFSGQSGHPKNAGGPLLRDGPYAAQIGDTFLNRLMAEGVAPREALERYLALDIARVAHLDRLLELHVGAQASRDEKTGFDLSSLIAERFRDECLFLTSSHPTLTLMIPLIRNVFDRLGVPSAAIEGALQAQRVTPFSKTALPIHPGVIRHFGLRFVDERSRYRYAHEGAFTFEEFVIRYMTFTWNEELVEGMSLAHGRELDRAVATLGRALLRSPDSAGGWRTMSHLLQRKRRLPEARSAALCSIALDPTDPLGPTELARVLLAERHLASAEAEARRAISLFPSEARAHRVLAEILDAAGRLEEAVRASEHAVALAPGDAHCLHTLSQVLVHLARLQEAEKALRGAIQLDSALASFHTSLADVLARQGRHEEGRAVLNDLVARGSRDAHVHAMIGHILVRENRFGEAEQAFGSAIEIDPSVTGFHTSLAHVLARQEKYREALVVLRKLIAVGSRDGHVHSLVGHNLARLHDYDGAEAAFRDAIAFQPSLSSEALKWIADVQRRREQRARSNVST